MIDEATKGEAAMTSGRKPRPISKVMLAVPNFHALGKRSWKVPPYGLALLNAALGDRYDSWIYDPNFDDEPDTVIRAELQNTRPDVVGVTSYSTEYIAELRHFTRVVRSELPDAIIVAGGVVPTVLPEVAIADPSVDYCIRGEGERRLPDLLAAITAGGDGPGEIEGVAHKLGGRPCAGTPGGFIEDLDALPLPDYGELEFLRYANHVATFSPGLTPRNYPFATSLTTRGCPYRCTFCAAKTVSGTRVRTRSAASVLREIDTLRDRYGIREMIFLDDHFLADRERALTIMDGIAQRPDVLSWKCANVAIFSLDDEVLERMRDTGCYQLTVSIESGHPHVLKHLVKKPVNLESAPGVLARAKELGFEIICNFVFGFPDETWEQIRHSITYAEGLPVDVVNFHIATPLPKTELMELCVERGYLASELDLAGYTAGVISTAEFTAQDLQILRAYEWDRINFTTPERRATMARLHGLDEAGTDQWRRRTRANLGCFTAPETNEN